MTQSFNAGLKAVREIKLPDELVDALKRIAREKFTECLTLTERDAINNARNVLAEFESGQRFEIQTYTLCGGWVNCWMTDERPETFATEAEAQAEIDQHVKDCLEDRIDDEENIREHLRIERCPTV